MAQLRDQAERVSRGRFAAGSAGVATVVFGLLAVWGTGLSGATFGYLRDSGPFWDLGWMFTALVWTSTSGAAAVAAGTCAGLTVLVLVAGLLTRGFRSAPAVAERLVDLTAIVSFVPLLLLVLPFVGGCLLWVLTWISTSFGTCVPPECDGVPAVP